jgi:hypothetical protein
MKPIQFLLVAFALFALVRVFQKYKQRGLRTSEFLFWGLIWLSTGAIVIVPETTSFLADFLGIGRGTDLILYSSLLVVFYMIFRIHLTLDQVEAEITELVRTAALARMSERHKERPPQ